MPRINFQQATETLAALRDQVAQGSADDARLAFLGFCMDNLTLSSGQFLQDLWVAYELGLQRGGYFVEFGAGDGRYASNTWFLERELGWSGIVAEPARIRQAALARNRACHVDTRCVWIESGRTLLFNETPQTGLSTIDSFSDADAHGPARRDGRRYPVETVSLNDLLTHWNAPRRIDFLSIDTEGSELDILQHFDLAAWDVRLIAVEHNFTSRREPVFELLTGLGYRRRFETLSNVDDWYMKDS